MSTTVARRIRRIGLMLSLPVAEGQKRVKRFDPDLTSESRDLIAAQLRHDAKDRRESQLAIGQRRTPRVEHRRSKARRKAAK